LRVIRDDRRAVVASDGAAVHRFTSPPDMQLVTGDWIAADSERVVAVAQRSSTVVRARANGDPQVLAANVDLVGVVMSLDRTFNLRRLERGLVLAWESGALPVVVLTKADAADDADAKATAAAAAAPSVDVVVTSVVDGRGMEQLRTLLAPRQTMVLLGASGAGKSSLVNALMGTEVMPTQAVRSGDSKGKHTTTHRELLVVPGGGVLLDTPGLRALAVGASHEGMDRAFPEVEELATACRFFDCRHDAEPGCAVMEALETGLLDGARIDAWRRIRREVESAQLRADPVAARKRGRQWGRISREAMQLKQTKDLSRPSDR
jgi:ribosome biogenesis GTPase